MTAPVRPIDAGSLIRESERKLGRVSSRAGSRPVCMVTKPSRALPLPTAVGEGDRLPILVDGAEVELVDFLRRCARSLGVGTVDESFAWVRDRFIAGGRRALAVRPAGGLTHRGIRLHPDADYGRCCASLADLARSLIAQDLADEFFFMNKPPGLRVRFLPRKGAGERLDRAVDGGLADLAAEGLIGAPTHGMYEPESQLFGGPLSMDLVHSLFTVDSLIWLDIHAAGDCGDLPVWLVSFAVLREIFAALEISGWEDIGVWAGVRDRGLRRVTGDARAAAGFSGVAEQIRKVWAGRDIIEHVLPDAPANILRRYAPLLTAAATSWRTGYFESGEAATGPRAAMAMFVVFHWNRGLLSAWDQGMIAESLADRTC